MLRKSSWTAVCLFALPLLGGCGAGGAANKPASGSTETTTASKSDASQVAPSRYAAPEPAAMAEMMKSTRSSASASPDAGASAAPALGIPAPAIPNAEPGDQGQGPGKGGDKFAYTEENPFLNVKDSPLSTFSIDVDTASYSKTRAYLLQHHSLPPADAVRVEEMINYFDYSYSPPTDSHPFAVHIETAACPWQPKHRLVRFGIQGKKLDKQRPASNLVFLLDVSGSMNEQNKLPLVIKGMTMLGDQLGENDRVSVVVYAGAAGLVLAPTRGDDHQKLKVAVEQLHAGGSTNGGEGIQLAYRIAEENFIKGGVNRVLLCTDGDFNVGTTSSGDLVRLAIDKAQSGVFLSVLGFGFGNHNDAMLEQIADKANGNYAFIDSEAEARKVLVEQLSGTLVTIAKDVKIQVEFNPAQVASYRLIGYENRKLADRDFNDDKKDAGEIGAGHSVTALYELIPQGAEPVTPEVDPLKYQKNAASADSVASQEKSETAAAKPEFADELLTLKMRYQPPEGGQSTLMTFPVKDSQAKFGAASHDFQFATAVASFGMLLRNSQYKGETSYAAVLETAAAAKDEDKYGYRAEFLEMVQAAQRLSGKGAGAVPADWQAVRTVNPVGLHGVPPQYATPSPSVSGYFPFPILAVGILIGVGACIITLAAVFALASIWNYALAPRHLIAGVPPLKKG